MKNHFSDGCTKIQQVHQVVIHSRIESIGYQKISFLLSKSSRGMNIL